MQRPSFLDRTKEAAAQKAAAQHDQPQESSDTSPNRRSIAFRRAQTDKEKQAKAEEVADASALEQQQQQLQNNGMRRLRSMRKSIDQRSPEREANQAV